MTSIDKNLKTLSLTKSEVQLTLERTYFLLLVAVNIAGLSSRAVSNGVVIDRTVPEDGNVVAQYVLPLSYDRNKNTVPGSSFAVSWTGFSDKESGIAHYSWAVGINLQTTLNLDDHLYTPITAEESVGGVQIMNFTLVGNSTYYVCIRATNGAGLQKTNCAPGIRVVLGQFSAGVVKDGPSKSGKDSDFQLDDRALWANWDGFKDPVYGISAFEWCIGDHQPSLSDKNICKWPYMKVSHLNQKAHRFYNLTLSHGTTYYATVKAVNSRGESVRATSDGVLVDRSHPNGNGIKVSPTTKDTDTLYMSSLSAPTVTWNMEDKESGMSYFHIGVGSFPFQDDMLRYTRISSLARSVDLDDFNFTMSQGLSFYVTIVGFNMLGLQTTLITQQAVVDLTSPSAGVVNDGGNNSHVGHDMDYQNDTRILSAHWYGFEDPESDIVEYKWCIGVKQGKWTSYSIDTKKIKILCLCCNVIQKILCLEFSLYS